MAADPLKQTKATVYMITIQAVYNKNTGNDGPTYYLVVNGEVIADSFVTPQGDRVSARLFGRTLIEGIGDATTSDLAFQVEELRCPHPSPWPDLNCWASLSFPDPEDFSSWKLSLELDVRTDDWAGPWSIAEYRRALHGAFADSTIAGLSLSTEDPRTNFHDGPRLWCALSSPEAIIADEVDHWLAIVGSVLEPVKDFLAAEAGRNTLVQFFNFAPEVSTACEQYLLYFVQFLRDLGIEANATVKHQAHRVLFAVTPDSGADALDRVREALEIYLRIPGAPSLDASADDFPDIAVRQLQANVYHLKSQVALAGALLEAKDARIAALELSNYRYKELLADAKQLAHLNLLAPPEKQQDSEPLIPGVVTLMPFESKGFKVELPEIFRRLKRRFGSG